ncbi:hypothetical protein NE850_27605 [Paraburkholderia sp. USG1]|uniref:hypothetical protein n=1 Tax=Paraburkholderia sp. USG1 TaxID=2952268 RepID=UPI0028588133|nr:hypothetical protein [Paraburkholderia sp. USG1]MDR8400080.1 hypothetical protein [Paraburkholderia sp. USG1]
MKERPILFSGPMVRALLDGSKTQTRRVVKHQPPDDVAHITVAHYEPTVVDWRGEEEPGSVIFGAYSEDGSWGCKCPHGQPGDRLWVRETWRGVVEINPPGKSMELGVARYVPDQEYCRRVEYQATQGRDSEPWRPSIHMPRWASRITLEVIGVRVERLQDCSEQDAIAEGIGKTPAGFWSTYGRSGVDGTYSPRSSFHCLWELINGAESWAANPWVWVVEFKRVT